ncbi:MAG: hypothetical protein HOV97_07950, partial [Nonomuraea sp.]|nr:hypothetical protein [Nonomuraea sp.]
RAREVEALRTALQRAGVRIRVVHHLHAEEPCGEVAVYARCGLDGGTVWGAGAGPDVVAAALAAVAAAASAARRKGLLPAPAAQDVPLPDVGGPRRAAGRSRRLMAGR